MLYNKFEQNIAKLLSSRGLAKLAVAVSGGADSTALLLLAHEWAAANNCEIVVMTVNHNLRPEAKAECDYVAQLSESLGLQCFQLNWYPLDLLPNPTTESNLGVDPVLKSSRTFEYAAVLRSVSPANSFSVASFAGGLLGISGNMQAVARAGRYKLMTDLCHKLSISTLLTAHHQDDYIENFLIRKKRKSGCFGLSSSNITFHNNIRILRALFDISKAQLIDYLKAKKIQWFEDESNYSSKYQRGQIRSLFSSYTETELSKVKHSILDEQATINLKAETLSKELAAAIAEAVAINQLGFAIIDLAIFSKMNSEIKLHLLNFILTIIGGELKIPRAESTFLIIALLEDNQKFNKTIHGCSVKNLNGSLLVHRCFGKKIPPAIIWQNGAIWDNRFRCEELGLPKKTKLYVDSLTMEEYRTIKSELQLDQLKALSFNNHQAILFTLPMLKLTKIEGETTIIPPSSLRRNSSADIPFSICFKPLFTSRFIHFI